MSELESYLKGHSGVWDYITTNILPYNEKFAGPWVGQTPHMGNVATSRVESTHQYIKGFVGTTKGDLVKVITCLQHAVDAQIIQTTHEMGR